MRSGFIKLATSLAATLLVNALAGCGPQDDTPLAKTSTPAPRPTATRSALPTLAHTALPSSTQTVIPPTQTPKATATVSVTATAIPATETPRAASTLSATATAIPSPRPTLPPSSTGLYVGSGKRDITPPGNVFLGGYGLGPGRKSTGVLAPIFVRAMVISDGTHAVVFAENETQGTFAAYKRGPFGLSDVRREVERATGGFIQADHIVIGSDHSHAGIDTSGVWGGLTVPNMTRIKDQTVGAILDAWNDLKPAQLRIGAVDASEYLHSQFDAPNDAVDGELRVLVASDPDDASKVQTMMINYAAHSTVMGADNLLISGDWPAVVSAKMEDRLGIGSALIMVADIGRIQPSRAEGEGNLGKLEDYGTKIAAKVQTAMQSLEPVTGTKLDAAQLFLRDTYNNRFLDASILLGLVGRNGSPPWVETQGDTFHVGTLTSTLRIGDLFFLAIPGEGYPAIFFELRDRVQAQKHFVFGLANDQLGYLIAPQEGYEQVAAAAPDNDNALFNVSPTIGDHVMCTTFKAARRLGYSLPPDPEKCAAYADEDNHVPN